MNKEIEDAVEYFKTAGKVVVDLEDRKHFETLFNLAEQVINVKVPEKKETESYFDFDAGEAVGFNEAHDLFTPLLVAKDLEIAEAQKCPWCGSNDLVK